MAVKQRFEPPVMADEDERLSIGVDFAEKEVEEHCPGVFVQRRCGLVRDHESGIADQRPGGGNALLLSDAEIRNRSSR